MPAVLATTSGLHDILINLVFNAVDAMPDGGRITIRTRADDGGVHLTVSDTGIGMEEDTRRRVFEPFFTTKMNVGTGLGLSTVYGTVTRWKGIIEVKSVPGRGTTFSIRLPGSGESGESVQGRSKVRDARRGRILIVEDESSVSQFLCRMLSAGHQVETLAGGVGAASRLLERRYDVALIDLGMRGMSGAQVAQEIKRADPTVATVLITGWELQADDPRVCLFDFWIQKPFDNLDRVRDLVAKALDLHDARVRGEAEKGTAVVRD